MPPFISGLRAILSTNVPTKLLWRLIGLALERRAERSAGLTYEKALWAVYWPWPKRFNSWHIVRAALGFVEQTGKRTINPSVRQWQVAARIGYVGNGQLDNTRSTVSQLDVLDSADVLKRRPLDPNREHAPGTSGCNYIVSQAQTCRALALPDGRASLDLVPNPPITTSRLAVVANRDGGIGNISPGFLDHVVWDQRGLGFFPMRVRFALGAVGEMAEDELARLLGVTRVTKPLKRLAEHGAAEKQGKLWTPLDVDLDRLAGELTFVVNGELRTVAELPGMFAEAYANHQRQFQENVLSVPGRWQRVLERHRRPRPRPLKGGASGTTRARLLTDDEIDQRIAAAEPAADWSEPE